MKEIRYDGRLIADLLKVEKEINNLRNKKSELERKIQIAIGCGFDIEEYEEELNLVSIKLKVYNTIY